MYNIKDGKKVSFYLPGFWTQYKLNAEFIKLYENNREYFYDNVEIAAFYDSFPNMIWNGGRYCIEKCIKEDIVNCLDFYNSKGYPCRFTFTNTLLEEKHLSDTFCNMVCKLGENGLNEILVNSDLLENYIRTNYPKYPIISSTTKCIDSVEDFNKELEKDYKIVVLNYLYNKDDEYLSKIKDKDRVEILVNDTCMPNCTRRAEHYKAISKAVLETSNCDFYCPYENKHFHEMFNEGVIFTHEEIQSHINKGFHLFKLEGRKKHPIDLIESYLYYLIKPEYINILRTQILIAIY